MHPETTPGIRPEKKERQKAQNENRFSILSQAFEKFGRGRRHKLSPAEGKEGKLPIPEYGLEYDSI